MSQSHFVVTQKMSYRMESPPCNHLTFREFFHEMTIECDPRTQGFETLFSRPSSDHRAIHHNSRFQTVGGLTSTTQLLPTQISVQLFPGVHTMHEPCV